MSDRWTRADQMLDDMRESGIEVEAYDRDLAEKLAGRGWRKVADDEVVLDRDDAEWSITVLEAHARIHGGGSLAVDRLRAALDSQQPETEYGKTVKVDHPGGETTSYAHQTEPGPERAHGPEFVHRRPDLGLHFEIDKSRVAGPDEVVVKRADIEAVVTGTFSPPQHHRLCSALEDQADAIEGRLAEGVPRDPIRPTGRPQHWTEAFGLIQRAEDRAAKRGRDEALAVVADALIAERNEWYEDGGETDLLIGAALGDLAKRIREARP